MKKISVIIPAYNEENSIGDCIDSLLKQSVKDVEIIIVDDDSTDRSVEVAKDFPVKILFQKHLGAGMARNLGASVASGEILVFVDADMTFDHEFIEKLTKPIRDGEAIGTFSKEEYVLNKNNVWSKCWNINRNLPVGRMHPNNYPDKQPVFRAILKSEFDKVKGFDGIGYVDDHTLAKKLGVEAVNAPNAVFYHKNPENLDEIYQQARWIGKSEFKNRKIKNEDLMKVFTIIRYSFPFSLLIGLYKSLKYQLPQFLIFKLVFDFAIEVSVIKSFFGEQKYK